MKYAVEMRSGVMIFVHTKCHKIGSDFQNSIGGYTDT
jgi:hypothetical protein